MRGKEILFQLALAVLGASLGCRPATEPSGNQQPAPQSKSSADPDRGPKVEPVAAEPATEDPERADKLADLDDMCKALDHDYVDGTLSDYYGDVQPRTAWGKAQREAGNQSIQPGRLLEKAVAELSPGAKDPALEHCRKLLDYLDDVE